MVTLLLPEGTAQEEAERILDQTLEACGQLGITLVGGHTEVTYGLPRPLAVGAMLGEVDKDRVVLTSGAKPGDGIVLTKGIAIEGTALLAREATEALRNAGIGQDTIEGAKNLLFSPGISVASDAAIARDAVEVHSMHDPTEGGLATGLLELAAAAHVGLTVDEDRIPKLRECEEFCSALGLEPLGLIASGALVATVALHDVPRLIEALVQGGIAAYEIGRITHPDQGLKIRTPQGVRDLPMFERDELARYFGR